MHITQILFWCLSVVALFSALMVISSRNPVYSVLWLIVTFFSVFTIFSHSPNCDRQRPHLATHRAAGSTLKLRQGK